MKKNLLCSVFLYCSLIEGSFLSADEGMDQGEIFDPTAELLPVKESPLLEGKVLQLISEAEIKADEKLAPQNLTASAPEPSIVKESSSLELIAAQQPASKTKAKKNEPAKEDRRQTVYIQGEFLYWKATTEAMPYVSSSEPIVPAPFFTGLNNLKLHRVSFGYDPGFKVGVGYHLPYDLWDVFFNWTWFRTEDHSSMSRSSDRILWSIWDQLAIISPLHASATQKLHLNVFDLELGRSIVFSPAFSIRPLIGVRGALIDQNFNVVYEDSTLPSVFDRHHLENDFHAVGLRAGLNLQWSFKNGLGFYGKSALSALASKIKVSHHQTIEGSPTPLHPSAFLDESSIKASLEVSGGINWHTRFSKDRFCFTLNLGYEVNYWPNQDQLFLTFVTGQNTQVTTVPISQRGDLGFQGGVLGARFDF